MRMIIPYEIQNSKWDHNELRYALRSIEKNLKIDVDITIVGTGIPSWLKNVEFIETERFYPENVLARYGGNKLYENYYDTLHKLDVISSEGNGDFIYMYDDILFIKPVHKIERIAVGKEKDSYGRKRGNTRHGATINRAITLLGDMSPKYNYETHMPRVFNCGLLRNMFLDYDYTLGGIPYAPSTLYYNLYFKEPEGMIESGNKYKAGFYGQPKNVESFLNNTRKSIEDAVKDKMYVNYNDKGLRIRGIGSIFHLKDWIENQFPKKSKYEN